MSPEPSAQPAETQLSLMPITCCFSPSPCPLPLSRPSCGRTTLGTIHAKITSPVVGVKKTEVRHRACRHSSGNPSALELTLLAVPSHSSTSALPSSLLTPPLFRNDRLPLPRLPSTRSRTSSRANSRIVSWRWSALFGDMQFIVVYFPCIDRGT